MGLETQDTGGDDGASFKSAPGLAQVMQDEGTRDQNANILKLFLDNASLQGGAPAPITQFVGTLDVTTSSVVFNGNFTRERYGKAAVSDNITLESDRRSLLLDDNQTEEQKAISILSALEFDNGLSAVQSMSDADVTGVPPPSNIDFLDDRPDSLYQNTGALSGAKRDHLMTSFTGQAEPEFIDAMVSQAGGEPTNFATFADVVADQTIMQSIAADDIATSMLSSHPNGAPEMASSQTAMDAVAASQTAMDAVAVSQTALDSVAASQTAASSVAASSTAVGAIEGASSSGSSSVPITNNASIYVAELAGGGGGGGDDSSDDFSGPGGPGEDTLFHQSVAEGGEGGPQSGGAGSGGVGTVSSPDEPLNNITGGAGNGGAGAQGGGDGGGGGFVKALIINPDRQSLSLTVGSGGSGGGNAGADGGDGSATIFTPNAFQ